MQNRSNFRRLLFVFNVEISIILNLQISKVGFFVFYCLTFYMILYETGDICCYCSVIFYYILHILSPFLSLSFSLFLRKIRFSCMQS